MRRKPICPSCGINDKGERLPYCFSCHARITSQWKINNREQWKRQQREWRAKNPDKILAANDKQREKRTGFSREKINQSLSEQNHKCAICEESIEGSQVAADHNHVTGQARGLLCWRCNRGLGHFRDDIRLFEKAIQYLKRYDK